MTPSSTLAPPSGPAESGQLVHVKLSGAWERACAGEWLPVIFELTHRAADGRAVRLQKLVSNDGEVQLHTDLLQPGVELRPGEVYRFTAGLCAKRAQLLDLGKLALVFTQQDESGHDLVLSVPSSTQKVQVRPSIGSEIEIRLEALCRYDEGTKILLTLKHQGSTPFEQFAVTLAPAAAIRAGKPAVARPRFGPGDEEHLELVVDQPELEVLLAASVGDLRPEARRRLRVEPPAPADGKRFRFLEPRRLARDRQRIYEIAGDRPPRAVAQPGGVYLLESGCQYRVEIVPMQPGVRAVKLNDNAGLFQVRKSERDPKLGGWVFTLDVTAPQLLRRPERLFYEMETADGKLTGEIPVSVKQSAWGYWRVALALGAATTAQGVAALGRFLRQADASLLDSLSEFNPAEHFSLFFLLSIPTAWLGLRLFDRLQYLFRT